MKCIHWSGVYTGTQDEIRAQCLAACGVDLFPPKASPTRAETVSGINAAVLALPAEVRGQIGEIWVVASHMVDLGDITGAQSYFAQKLPALQAIAATDESGDLAAALEQIQDLVSSL